MEPPIELATAFFAAADRDPETIEKYERSGYHDDPRAQTIARIIENDLGVREIVVLGGGAYGVAAATAEEGGDVIKLTTDVTEVESGTVLTNTAIDKYPANVVHVQGAWFVRRMRVLADSWWDPKTEIWHHAHKRIGLLRMERVHALDTWDDAHTIQGLSEYVRFVKHKYKTWPHLTRKISRAAARDRYLRAGTELERLLMEVWRDTNDQASRDVAHAIAQLRALGVYGVDFHGGNIGWTDASPSARPPGAAERLKRNPVEETLEYRGYSFDLITSKNESGREVYLVRVISFDQVYGPFGVRDEAITFAHDKIDEVLAPPEREPVYEHIYKVFDIGESSVGMGAPKPKEVGRSRSRVDKEAYESPILARSVKVAELG